MSKKLIVALVCVLMLVSVLALSGCGIEDNFDDQYFDQMRQEDSARVEGSNIRIMSANVLVHMVNGWGGSKVSPRAEIFTEAIKHYSPDVIGTQEFCGCWYKEMPRRAENYKILSTKKSDYTTMMYNSDTVKLITEGKVKYSKRGSANCRIAVWGVFEKLVTGEKFAVISTHWDFGMEEKKVAMRDTQIDELNDLVDMLTKTYDVPVFSVGDYNVFERSVEDGAESYVKFLDKSRMHNAKYADGIVRKSLSRDYDDESWDHIFYKGKVDAKGFGILYSQYFETLSDHPLIYMDAKI